MTPQPPPLYLARVRAALDATYDAGPTQQVTAVADAVSVSWPAAQQLIALIRARDQARRDAQYIP